MLSASEEAQALAAVIDLKGGAATARRLAKAVGHSEAWVKSRLSLMALTDAALDSLHDGKLTLDVATSLTALADQPDVIDQLVTGNRALSAWQVESTVRTLRHEAALAAASERLTAKGTTVVTEQDYTDHARAWRTVDDLLGRDQARSHRTEPCHAVVIKASWDGTTVTEIALCTEPRRNKGNQPASSLMSPARHRAARSTRQPRNDASVALPPKPVPSGSHRDSPPATRSRAPTPHDWHSSPGSTPLPRCTPRRQASSSASTPPLPSAGGSTGTEHWSTQPRPIRSGCPSSPPRSQPSSPRTAAESAAPPVQPHAATSTRSRLGATNQPKPSERNASQQRMSNRRLTTTRTGIEAPPNGGASSRLRTRTRSSPTYRGDPTQSAAQKLLTHVHQRCLHVLRPARSRLCRRV